MQNIDKQVNLILNGPSFKSEEIVNKELDCFAVNQFAIHEIYQQLKPNNYLFCDSFYWKTNVSEFYKSRRKAAFNALSQKTSWEMSLWIPDDCSNIEIFNENIKNSKIKICKYKSNTSILIPYGLLRRIRFLIDFLWSKSLVAPPPINVIFPALYLCKILNYRTIFLYGADQDYFKGYKVDKTNVLYRETNYHNEVLQKKIFAEKMDINPSNIGDELIKHGEIFKLIDKYNEALKRSGVEVVNMNEFSMIDSIKKFKGD